jgi:predicted outer membrane protein
MVTDHTKTTSELQRLAPAANVSLPKQMTASQEEMLDKLKGLNGNDFAKQYMDDQVGAHKDAVSPFERYGKGGDNDQLKSNSADPATPPRYGTRHLQEHVIRDNHAARSCFTVSTCWQREQ